jgi:GINS complex subunit 4
MNFDLSDDLGVASPGSQRPSQSQGAEGALGMQSSAAFSAAADMDGGFDDMDDEDVSDVLVLTRALLSERGSPQLLPFENVVNDLNRVIVHQQKMVDEAMEDAERSADEKFAASMYQMEIDRIKYLVGAYLRTRLRKIQLFPAHILKSDLKSRLSRAELKFLSTYVRLMERHLHDSALREIPENFQNMYDDGAQTGIPMIPSPNLHKYVFVQALDNIGDVVIENETVTISQGDVYAVCFKPIEALLLEGKMRIL